MGVIAGVDEVGRGPLAGPVVAAAVILEPGISIEGLTDSKKISAKKREKLCEVIKKTCLSWAIGHATVEEIDDMNILQASLLAMRRAIESLDVKPEHAQVDGNFLPKIDCSAEAIIGGDSLIPSISAASIIAKVFRDKKMTQYDEIYPGYGFAKNSGYGTAQHLTAIRELGITPIHRKSFAPVKKVIEGGQVKPED